MDEKNSGGQDLIKFALEELKKTIDGIKKGKNPVVSRDLKKITDMLNDSWAAVNKKKISEEDMNEVVEEAVKKASKEPEKK